MLLPHLLEKNMQATRLLADGNANTRNKSHAYHNQHKCNYKVLDFFFYSDS